MLGLVLVPVASLGAVEPVLPVGMGRIEMLDIPGRWGRVDAFARGRLDLHRLGD